MVVVKFNIFKNLTESSTIVHNFNIQDLRTINSLDFQ